MCVRLDQATLSDITNVMIRTDASNPARIVLHIHLHPARSTLSGPPEPHSS